MHTEALEKPLPHDDLMEQALIGAILAGHRQANEMLDGLQAGYFFDDRHRKIAETMIELRAAGIQLDLISVCGELTRAQKLEAAGGGAYVSSLVQSIGLAGGVDYILRGLRRMTALRRAVHIAENIKQLALEQTGSVGLLADAAVEQFSSLAREIDCADDDGTPYFDASTAALSTAKEGARIKIYTDVSELDAWTGGFRETEVVVVTAETGTGKSLFAAQIRARACRDGYHAMFCSGEMTAAHLASRELSSTSGVAPIRMRRDDLLTEQDFTALVT